MSRLLTIEGDGDLQDALFDAGVEFPCGGTELCGGCRIRVVSGDIPVTPEMRDALSAAELQAGWRLACRARASGPVTVEVAQWGLEILGDDSVVAAEPRPGLGLAIDIGTTTLVAQLLDLSTGEVLGVRTALNPQARYGADIMSRVEAARRDSLPLTQAIRSGLAVLVADLAQGRQIADCIAVGNTVMHHLFGGLDVAPLAQVPFETPHPGELTFSGDELGWPACRRVRFLPCLGSFVGSDILAGLAAIRIFESDRPVALIDLGTNGEIVVGDRSGAVCASTAAGPAFEAGRIHMGMRAAPGAIDRLAPTGRWHVIGGANPRGICGSGLVEAAAVGLDRGVILPSGRYAAGAREWMLREPVKLLQSDIRELQLAKAAIASGLRLLAEGRPPERIYLAGAFGNYIHVSSARRIGLLPRDGAPVEPAGNTALRGAKMLLLNPSLERQCAPYWPKVRHLSLRDDPRFMDWYVGEMPFPAA